MTRHISLAAALLVATARLSFAQANTPAPVAPSSSAQAIDEWVKLGEQASHVPAVKEPFASTLGHQGGSSLVAYIISLISEGKNPPEPYKKLVQAMEAQATKQIGAAPSSSGTTSVAMKGLVPEILGVALENGAITRDVDGTSLTFRATPAGVVKALQGNDLFQIFRDYGKSRASRFASRFSLAATFDTSLGPASGTFTADRHQLTGWSVRGELFNTRDPASPQYAALFGKMLDDSYFDASTAVETAFANSAALREWEKTLQDAVQPIDAQLAADLTAAGADQAKQATARAKAARLFRTALEAKLKELPEKMASANGLRAALDSYVDSLQGVQTGLDDVYDYVGKGTLSTLDFTAAREEALPDLYTLTFDLDTAFGVKRATSFTINAATSFYRSAPAEAGQQFKSFDLAGQLDRPLGRIGLLPPVTFTLAGKLSFLPDDVAVSKPDESGTTAAGVAPSGTIALVQVKLTIPVKRSGIKVPLSITAANRTELIKEADVRANFGITFDLDAILGSLKH